MSDVDWLPVVPLCCPAMPPFPTKFASLFLPWTSFTMAQELAQQIAAQIEFPDWLMNAVGETAFKVCAPALIPFDKALHDFLPEQMKVVDAWATGATQSKLASKMPLLSNPSYVAFALVAYMAILVLLYVFGKITGPLKVKALANLHNSFLFWLSLYMNVSIAVTALASGFTLWNNGVGADSNPNTWRMAKLIWLFYVSKLPEFVDTFIMMLKHNYRQVSFLHVYHHTTIFAIWYIVTSRAPGGDAYFSAMLNSGVHVVMYGYYWLTAMSSEESGLRKVLNKIKFYITKMQMLQFLFNVFQTIYNLFIVQDADRKYPKELAVILFVYMITLLALFGNFLVQNSGKGRSRSGSPAAAAGRKSAGSPNKRK